MKKVFCKNNQLVLIILIGLLIRVLFITWGANLYFNRPLIFVDGDTKAFTIPAENLINYGIYSGDLKHDQGYFSRLPGYPLFLSFFYSITNGDWSNAFLIIAWFQIFLDVFSIFLIYQIAQKIFQNKTIGLIAGFLYAFYPFIIIWNPVVYAESLSVFLLLLGAYFFFNFKGLIPTFFSGFIWGLGVLVRPQLFFLFPTVYIFSFFSNKSLNEYYKPALVFTLGFILSYGAWPARNLINYQKVVFTQKTESLPSYSSDVIAFRKYIYSVKSEWEPQFSQIVNGIEVTWPKRSYHSENDSILLIKVVDLVQNCGKGFSYWRHKPINEDCNDEIVQIFNDLRRNVIKEFPINYHIVVPFQNFFKAVFKINLIYNPATRAADLLSIFLFLWRTLLIIMGILGCFVMIKNKINFSFFALSFWLLVYFYINYVNRNVEIRYFLQADIIFLIPASYFVYFVFSKIIRGLTNV